MSPRMVPFTVCARSEYIAASTRLVHITTRNMFLPTDVFSILFCRCWVIYVTSTQHRLNKERCASIYKVASRHSVTAQSCLGGSAPDDTQFKQSEFQDRPTA